MRFAVEEEDKLSPAQVVVCAETALFASEDSVIGAKIRSWRGTICLQFRPCRPKRARRWQGAVRSSARSARTHRLRLAVIDRDPGFMQVLSNRLDTLGWDLRALSSAVTADALVSMRLNALVVDLAVLGPGSWEYLERVCSRLPGLAVIVCTGPSSVAQRVRGLRLGADAWITKPCHAEELICVIEAAIRRHRRNEMPEIEDATPRRRDHDSPRPLPGVPRRREPRADRPRVRDPAICSRSPIASCAARRSTSASGVMRWPTATVRSTCSSASCARSSASLRRLGLHPHPLRRRLPLRARAGRSWSATAKPSSSRSGSRTAAAGARVDARIATPPARLNPPSQRRAQLGSRHDAL